MTTPYKAYTVAKGQYLTTDKIIQLHNYLFYQTKLLVNNKMADCYELQNVVNHVSYE